MNSIIDRRPMSLGEGRATSRFDKGRLHVINPGLWHCDHATSWMVKSMAQQRLLSRYRIARDQTLTCFVGCLAPWESPIIVVDNKLLRACGANAELSKSTIATGSYDAKVKIAELDHGCRGKIPLSILDESGDHRAACTHVIVPKRGLARATAFRKPQIADEDQPASHLQSGPHWSTTTTPTRLDARNRERKGLNNVALALRSMTRGRKAF